MSFPEDQHHAHGAEHGPCAHAADRSAHASEALAEAEALCREKGHRRLAPITVYRALEFLMAEGLAHRLASRNAFVACPHRHGPGDLVAFLICDACGGVDEMSSAPLGRALSSLLKEERFEPHLQ